MSQVVVTVTVTVSERRSCVSTAATSRFHRCGSTVTFLNLALKLTTCASSLAQQEPGGRIPSVAETRVSVHLPKEYLITGLRRSLSAAVMAPEVTRLQQLRQHRTMQQNNSPLQKQKQNKKPQKRRGAGAVRTANPAHTPTGLSNTSSWKVCVVLRLAGVCTVFTAAGT